MFSCFYLCQYEIKEGLIGRENILVGLCTYPLENTDYQRSRDMWVMHGQTGKLYFDGLNEKDGTLPRFVIGNSLTCCYRSVTGYFGYALNEGTFQECFDGKLYGKKLHPCIIFNGSPQDVKVKLVLNFSCSDKWFIFHHKFNVKILLQFLRKSDHIPILAKLHSPK